MKRKTILVDLDNVVYDFILAIGEWLASNKVIERPFMRKYRTWEVWNDWNVPKGEFWRWWRLGIEAGEIYAKGPIIPGARDALWRLSDAEWDIHIATSRLTKFGLHDLIVLNTANWLRDNNIPYRSLHFTDDKVSIYADAIIDDRADNMSHVSHKRTFLFPANHNVDSNIYVDAQLQRDVWADIVKKLIGREA